MYTNKDLYGSENHIFSCIYDTGCFFMGPYFPKYSNLAAETFESYFNDGSEQNINARTILKTITV